MVLASIPSCPSPDTPTSHLPRLCPHQDSCLPLTWGDTPRPGQAWGSTGGSPISPLKLCSPRISLKAGLRTHSRGISGTALDLLSQTLHLSKSPGRLLPPNVSEALA